MKSPILILLFMVIGCFSCKNNQEPGINEDFSENNGNPNFSKKNIESFIGAFLNNKDEKGIDSLVTNNYLRNMNGIPVVTNKTELKARINLYTTGFPDHHISSSNSYVCENHGYVHWIFTGTHTGLFADVIATGKKVRINGFSHFYFNKDGQIYQEDIFYNELEFLQQLGYSLEAPRLK